MVGKLATEDVWTFKKENLRRAMFHLRCRRSGEPTQRSGLGVEDRFGEASRPRAPSHVGRQAGAWTRPGSTLAGAELPAGRDAGRRARRWVALLGRPRDLAAPRAQVEQV